MTTTNLISPMQFGLYRSFTNVLFGLWGLKCVRDAIRDESVESAQRKGLLRWDSASARWLVNGMFVAQCLDFPVIYLAKVTALTQ